MKFNVRAATLADIKVRKCWSLNLRLNTYLDYHPLVSVRLCLFDILVNVVPYSIKLKHISCELGIFKEVVLFRKYTLLSYLNTYVRSELFWDITQRIGSNSLSTFWGQPLSLILKSILGRLKMRPMCRPETSVNIDHYKLCNITGESWFYLLQGRRLKSRNVYIFLLGKKIWNRISPDKEQGDVLILL